VLVEVSDGHLCVISESHGIAYDRHPWLSGPPAQYLTLFSFFHSDTRSCTYFSARQIRGFGLCSWNGVQLGAHFMIVYSRVSGLFP